VSPEQWLRIQRGTRVSAVCRTWSNCSKREAAIMAEINGVVKYGEIAKDQSRISLVFSWIQQGSDSLRLRIDSR